MFESNSAVMQYNLQSRIAAIGKKFVSRAIELKKEGKNILEIRIEGHTDTDGSYMYNLQLSQNRALAVAAYCLDEKSGLLTESELNDLRGLLTANGRSWSAPVYAADGSVDMGASRRVEIKFRLKDDEMMAQLAEILEGF